MAAGAAVALETLLVSLKDELTLVEREIARMVESDAAPVRDLLRHISKFGGKRLRPALVLLAGRMYGGISPQHTPVAAIVELIHTATLVHDDILDESSLRRAMETVNRKVGNETAVLLGDYLFSTAFKEAALLEDRYPARYLSEVVTIVCAGEIRQIHNRNNLELTEETYFRIIEAKTAVLYAAALRCGARLAGAPDDQAEALSRFGLRIGSAFQIIDDILDLDGEEGVVGKSLGTDIEKAKMTLPLLRLRDRATPGDRARLEDAIREGGPGSRQAIRPLLEEYGAIESARTTAAEFVERARRHLDLVPDVPERAQLMQAAEFILARDR